MPREDIRNPSVADVFWGMHVRLRQIEGHLINPKFYFSRDAHVLGSIWNMQTGKSKYKFHLKIIQQTVTFVISLNCVSNNQTLDNPLKNIRLTDIIDHTQISLKVQIASYVTHQKTLEHFKHCLSEIKYLDHCHYIQFMQMKQ